MEEELSLRPAEVGDLELMLAWRNNPDIYEYLKRQDGPITWEDHLQWFATRDPTRRDWIIRYNGRRVGSVVIAEDGDIGVWIGETSAWGDGIARLAVERAMTKVEREVHACIHEENTPSRRLFESLGFERTSTDATDDEWLIYEP